MHFAWPIVAVASQIPGRPSGDNLEYHIRKSNRVNDFRDKNW